MHNRTNVVLLVADALGAGHLSCYGYPRPTSPRVDAIAAEGALFERYFCSGLPTQPSFTTLYTGQHPIEHGIVSHGGSAELSPHTPTLPMAFLKAGYATCALDNLMRERLWFGRGYEYYIDPSLRRILSLGVTCDELNRRAIPWIREHREEPFFLFIHYWDTHTPYAPPERYRGLFYSGTPVDPDNHSLDEFWKHPFGRLARDTWLRTSKGVVTDAEYVTALYDQEVRYVNDGIAEVVAAIDDARLRENTVVAISGDHGESMTEHGIFYEHHGLYDSVLQIPLILRWPGKIRSEMRIHSMFQHQDLAPTLLEAAQIPIPRSMSGQSFWSVAIGSVPDLGRDKLISCESTLQAKWSLRTSDYKFILAREDDYYGTPARELYDLNADPGETVNLVEQRPTIVREMEEELESWISAQLAKKGASVDPVREQGISLRAVLTDVY
jgi:arylsulfatase A-like enzyme